MDDKCEHCGAPVDDDGYSFCPHCGTPLKETLYDEAADTVLPTKTLVGTSSAGRHPVVYGTGPEQRALFLERLRGGQDVTADGTVDDDSDGGALFRKIARAEKAVELHEGELFRARGQAEAARAQCPEVGLDGHDLSPSGRTWFLQWRGAEGEEAEAERALNDAEATLRRLLGVLDDIQKPHLGVTRPVDDEGEGMTLGDHERAADRARRQRRRIC